MCFRILSHYIIISRLEMIDLCETVYKCFSSYILNRSSSMKICNFSNNIVLLIMVFLRNLFSAPPLLNIHPPYRDIIGQFQVFHYHIYADDIQLYSFLSNSSKVLPIISQLCKYASKCTSISWLLSNNL